MGQVTIYTTDPCSFCTRVKSLLRVRHMKSELERALSYLNEIEHDEEA